MRGSTVSLEGDASASAPIPEVVPVMAISDAWDFDELLSYERVDLSQARLFNQSCASDLHFLFVHGAYHGAWCWVPMMRALQSLDYGVSAIDIRGHGGLAQREAFVRQGLSYAADDVVEAANCLRDKNLVLVGHSLGGLIAMMAAEQLNLHALVLMAPSPPGQLEGLEPLPAYPENQLIQPPAASVAKEKFFAGYEGDISEAVKRLCPESPAMMNDRYRLRVTIDRNKMNCPSLCLAAGRDLPHLHPPGQDEAVSTFLAGQYMFLPHSAHDMMLDSHRHTVLRAMLDWLSNIEPA